MIATAFVIFESKHFVIAAVEHPLIDRNDGGHIVIEPKVRIPDRQALTPTMAIELMRLSMVAGEAFATVMNKHGVDVGRINYQDNGNWGVFKPEGPYFHLHLYGRAISAKVQKYGQSCYFPHRDEHPEFYASLRPLNDEDILALSVEVERLMKTSKYRDKQWF